MDKKTADSILPDEPLDAKINPNNLVVFIIAPPKWGKTKFFMSNPDCLHLGFEEGSKFQRGLKVVIDCWDTVRTKYPMKLDGDGVMHLTAMQALDALQASERYKFVAIDTVDMASKLCADYHLDKGSKEHLQDLGDYGKGYDVGQNTPMRQFIMKILKTGRGVGLISHSKVTLERFTSGEKARKESTLPKGVKTICESQADVIMHGEFGIRRTGNRLRDRILVCEGDMDILAGNRSGAMLPSRYIVSPNNAWKQFCAFFTDPNASILAEKKCAASIKMKE